MAILWEKKHMFHHRDTYTDTINLDSSRYEPNLFFFAQKQLPEKPWFDRREIGFLILIKDGIKTSHVLIIQSLSSHCHFYWPELIYSPFGRPSN